MKAIAMKPKQARSNSRSVREKGEAPRFWVRRCNPELDRTGGFILQNLARIRKEASSRAGAA